MPTLRETLKQRRDIERRTVGRPYRAENLDKRVDFEKRDHHTLPLASERLGARDVSTASTDWRRRRFRIQSSIEGTIP